MPPAARFGDWQVCPEATPQPHVGGPIASRCEPTVRIGNRPAARVLDQGICNYAAAVILEGSPTVLIGYRRAARQGDPTSHGGVIITGDPTVQIGG